MSGLPAGFPEATHTPLRGGPVLRWGVIGAGNIADAWASTVLRNTDQRVVAVASRSAEKAGEFARRHGIERAYGSAEELVGNAGVDAVYVATPHVRHREHALLALAAGKHVLVEKPFAVTAREAEEIAAAARATGLLAMEAMWTRFLPQTTVVRRLLDDGVLGPVRQVSADFGGRREFDPAHRLFDPALGGGALLDLGVYTVWFVTWVLGAPESVGVAGSLAPTGVDEQAVVTLARDGAFGVASCSIVAPTPVVAQVMGENARLVVDPPFCAPSGLRLEAGTGPGLAHLLEWFPSDGLRWRDGLCYQAAAFAKHAADGRGEAPEHPLSSTIGTLRIIDTARAALGAA